MALSAVTLQGPQPCRASEAVVQVNFQGLAYLCCLYQGFPGGARGEESAYQ